MALARFWFWISLVVGLVDGLGGTHAAEPTHRNSTVAGIQYVGSATWSGIARDRSGLSAPLEDGSPHDRLGGMGSGLAWTGQGDQFVMIADRGAGDGAVGYRCRYHTVTIRVEPESPTPVTLDLTQTTLLTGAAGQPLVGLAAAHSPQAAQQPERFDPEAIRVTPEGTLLISEEYGPSIREFDLNGVCKQTFSLPAGFTIAHPGNSPDDEFPPHNLRGRQPNRGLEGLALTPDGKHMVALMQGPLLQDGALDADNQRIGRLVRLLVIDRQTGQTTQFAYLLESAAYGLNEIEALGNQQCLVIERDGKVGKKAAFKRIARIDLTAATPLDPSGDWSHATLPVGFRPVAKEWYIDLLDPQWGLAGDDFPEKTEGLALGRTLSDGRRLLVVSTDNDFQPEVPSRIDVFALPSH